MAEMESRGSDSNWGPFRWNVLGIISLASTVLEAAVWSLFDPDRTTQVFMSLPVVSAMALAIVLWWLLGGGRRWNFIRRRLIVLLVLGLTYRLTVRFEGFEGDMIPRFSARWTPTAEEKLAQFLASRPTVTIGSVHEKQPAEDNSSKSTAEANGSEPSESPATLPIKRQLLVTETDWPGFRGATRDSRITDPAAKFDWSQVPQELWRHPVGAGWSSFAIVGPYAFTQEQRGEHESIVCYDAESGIEVWSHAESVRFDEPMAGPGPRATPTIHESRVYALGATGILNCLDALTGKPIWRREILTDAKAKNIDWAMAGSPLVIDGMVIVNPGGPNQQGVVAYDHLTGSPIWSGGSDQASYTAPTWVTILGVPQVVIFDGIGVAGHSPASGKQLWKFEWSNGPKVNAAEPALIGDDSLLIGSGYDRGGALIKLSRQGDTWSANSAWTAKQLRLKFNAPVIRDGYAYGLDERVMICVDVSNGKTQWRNGRYGYGQLLRCDDEIVVQAESGDVAVVKATPDRYEEIAKFPLLSSKTWNHPVICRDLLFVRNGEEAACFRLKRKLGK